ncbi:MAG: 3-hydroxybutyrate dehydrogenase [Betaproteobacteria bacterium HGW-Betaproteobacteria-14]|nr:MAG: 3-hydroxybutyrate dehydrogenase [Betaproteobacteria bacterium HGW-Betaproteobacteria-14]
MAEHSKRRLADKVAVVTGAASGIGRQIALAMAAEGAIVGIADINAGGAQDVEGEIRKAGGRAEAIHMDVRIERMVDDGINGFAAKHGRLDVAVANAGIQHLDTIADVSFEHWKDMLAVHLDGSFLTACAALRYMVPAKRGSIIFMGSIHSYMASEKKGPYVAAKHGIVGLCRAIAKENGRHGIRANTICPGFVRTPLIEFQLPLLAKERGVSEEEVVQGFLRYTVDGEYTTMAELAELAVFLAAFPTNLFNGQSIGASHGIHML